MPIEIFGSIEHNPIVTSGILTWFEYKTDPMPATTHATPVSPTISHDFGRSFFKPGRRHFHRSPSAEARTRRGVGPSAYSIYAARGISI